MTSPTDVVIRYRRPGRRDVEYRQKLVAEPAGCIVTCHPSTPIDTPMELRSGTVLEPGSPVVWFTFPGRWHDIGAFHLTDGTFTGLYANILTPVQLEARTVDRWEWSTTDLFLDIWLEAGTSNPRVLDREEFRQARDGLEDTVVASAEREVDLILRSVRNGTWPPAVVGEWPLSRVRELMPGAGTR